MQFTYKEAHKLYLCRLDVYTHILCSYVLTLAERLLGVEVIVACNACKIENE